MIAIPAFHFTDTKTHNVILPHALAQDLELYRQFYKTTYGAEVKEPDLIREIVRCFLERDPGFKNFKATGKSQTKGRIRATPLATKTTTDTGSPSSPPQDL